MKIDFITKNNISDKAIIFIHGWGGNKNSFLPFIKNMKVSKSQWFLPEAPYPIDKQPSTNSNQYNTSTSLNQKSWTYKKANGLWEINEPKKMLDNFLNDVVFANYNTENVYFIGFSQGAAICYEYVMGIKKKLGGIFPIGGFIFKNSNKKNLLSKENKNTPIIIGHGEKDDVIPIDKSKIAYKKLVKEKANVKFYKYTGGHKISIDYFREIIRTINGT
ncbi:MAG: hypothetical protein CBD97_01050 [Pelagibacteraceae bacterium TMED237]|nr:hypothetical protein [Candidatus Neomarinimicrobiota bacterium]OUW96653.1 MAG: hypothetical protein CBD97_01050 [Pelagibacteraceae bacterium TMED237]|tara:strand:+ start:3375 stop:4028 length:654 start_codon:yes stop_codon:yes gene_type:complete